MPLSCSVPHCKTGYGKAKPPPNVSLHKFPLKNSNLLKQWIKNISRKNFIPSKYACVCSLHFLTSDFIIQSQDKNEQRRKKRDTTLKRKILKPSAVPTQFENFPAYFVPPATIARSQNATSASRQQKVKQKHSKEVLNFFKSDIIHNLKEIEDQLLQENISQCK